MAGINGISHQIEENWNSANKFLDNNVITPVKNRFDTLEDANPKIFDIARKIVKATAIAGVLIAGFVIKNPILFAVGVAIGFFARYLPIARGPTKEIMDFARKFFNDRSPAGKLLTVGAGAALFLFEPGIFSGIAAGAYLAEETGRACDYLKKQAKSSL